MARFTTSVTSTAGLGANTAFAWVNAGSSAGFRLRRITVGVMAGTGAPTSQQVAVAIYRTTSAGTTPTAGVINKMDPNSGSAAATVASAFSAAPAQASSATYQTAFNSLATIDLPWEFIEELVVTAGTANGLAFVNLTNALPSAHSIVMSYEWEE